MLSVQRTCECRADESGYTLFSFNGTTKLVSKALAFNMEV